MPVAQGQTGGAQHFDGSQRPDGGQRHAVHPRHHRPERIAAAEALVGLDVGQTRDCLLERRHRDRGAPLTDLLTGKHTLPVILGLESSPSRLRHPLRTALRYAVGNPEAAHHAAEILERAGGRAAVENYRAHHLALAQATPSHADLPGRRSRAELASLIDSVVTHSR